jgi:hypothetical protein
MIRMAEATELYTKGRLPAPTVDDLIVWLRDIADSHERTRSMASVPLSQAELIVKRVEESVATLTEECAALETQLRPRTPRPDPKGYQEVGMGKVAATKGNLTALMEVWARPPPPP